MLELITSCLKYVTPYNDTGGLFDGYTLLYTIDMTTGWSFYSDPVDLYGNDKTVLCVLHQPGYSLMYDYAIRNLGEWKRQSSSTSRVAITLIYYANTAVLVFDSTKRIEYIGHYTVDVYYK